MALPSGLLSVQTHADTHFHRGCRMLRTQLNHLAQVSEVLADANAPTSGLKTIFPFQSNYVLETL